MSISSLRTSVLSSALISVHSLLLCAGINRKIRPCVCSFALWSDLCCLHLLLSSTSHCEPAQFRKCLGNALPGFSWWQNSNWETVPLHESNTCLSSLYWRLNPASPFTHPFLGYRGQSQQILTIVSCLKSWVICLLYSSGFTNFSLN